MARNDLLRQLIASPHALPPPQPRGLTVAPSAPLPANLRFGPANPSKTLNSPFSGAVAAGGPLNVVHPESPADFQSPSYSPLAPVSPVHNILTALAPILGAGLVGGGLGGTGAIAAAAPSFTGPPRPTAAGVLAAPTLSPAPGRPGPRGAPGSGGGLQPVSPALSAGFLASLAQAGQRLGSAGRGSNIIRM